MKKLNNYKRIWLILMILSPFFSLVKAQTCDPLLLKTLSETRVTYFDKVTKGEKATITIKYPLIGTTYTVTDNDGNSKSFTYTSGTEEFVDLEIDSPVNAVRRYSLKAEKDGCSFQTGFNYTITPETDVKLAIRVEQEWCGTSGAIRFKVVGTGVNNANYNFYLRKHNETYDFSTAKPHTGAISLAAGKYYVIAKRKSGSWTEPAESPEIEIKNDVKTIAFTASQIPKICGATSLGIRVDINQDQWGNHAANYPVYYTLYQSDGVTPVRPDTVHQTSNIFTGLTAGNYVVKVENFCGANPIPQPITLTDESFAFTHLYTPIAGKEFNCTKAQFDALYLYGTGIKKAVDSDAFNYPFTVKFTFTDPDGVVYTPTYVINNKTDLDTYLPKYYYGEALKVDTNFQEFNLPNKSGTWKVKADITMCGNTTSLAEVTSVLYNPIENAMVEVANDGTSPTACHTTQLRLRYKHRRDNSATLNTYLVIEQGPTRPSTDLFNYAGAGFSLMPATHSNPLLRGKYAKRILFSSYDFQTVVIPDYLRNGDTFNFRLVDDECDPTRYADLDPVIVTVPPTAVGVDIQVIASCEGATNLGAPNGSIRITRINGAAVKKIEIIEYTDTANVVHTTGTIGGTSLSLPYTLTDNNRADENNWYVRDLPKGKYKFRITDVCNNITIPNHVPQIAGQTYNLNFAPGCEPVVQGSITLGGTEDWRYNQSEFVIQHYKEDDQVWEEWAYAGLPYNTPINRKTTDEGLGKVGKFRIVRRIKNLENGYECQRVIAEREFAGDLSGIQVVGFGCNDKKYHVMLTPEGGTAPFTYKLVHKLPAGSATPDTSVARIQTGDQFFINLDGSNVNNAYKFAITDACGKTVEKELTIANIQKPKIEPKPKRDYYCTGQEVKLTITDLGPNVQVEWYREDNPSTPLATGFSYTIPSLTATDFAKKYYVKIKIPSQHAIEDCVTDEVDAFQFQESSVTVPPLARTNNGETLKCITGPTVFDVESLFNIPNSHLAANLPTGVTVRIREASGVIAVPNNHKINLRPRNGGQKPLGMGSYTFYYEVLSPCEKVITYQEAKLTVKELVDFQPKTTIKVCNANVTLDEIKQEIIKGSPKVTALQPDFTWYATESNARARTSPLVGSTSLSTPNGSSQDYWLRLTKNGYCTPEEPIKVTIKGETGVTAKNLGDVGCQLTTIASLKALIDPSDAANVLIYRRGTTVPLADDALIDNNEQYDYAKNIYQCVTAPQQVNFTFTPRTTAKNEQVDVCFYIGYYGLRTTLTQIKAKLQERYPTGATFKFYSAPEAIPANEYTSNREFIQSELFYFTVQEAGKCVSLPFSVRPGQNAMTEVETKTVTICEEITVGELITKMQTDFGYSNVKIHQGRGTGNMSDDTFVDWNNAIYFSAEEAGKCRSTKVPLIIKRNPNVTVATPKTFEVCKAVGQQPKVSDLKAVVGNDARIFVRDNNNRWVLQADTQNVYEANSYFYTIEEAGKCPSEKTALVVRITRKTTTPTAPASGIFCTGATIAALKDYIDNTPQNVGTIRVYATNTDTTPITDATALTDNTTYYFSLQDTDPTKCESDRRALVVTLVAKPTVNLTYTYCAGTKLETLWDDIDASDYNSDRSLKFYETATSTTALARNAVLRAGNYYVAESSTTSALGNCETTRVPLAVVLTKVTAITADLSETEVNYCKGATTVNKLSVTAEGTGTLSYKWYKAANTTDAGTEISGATTNEYTPVVTTEGTTYYYVKVSSTCGEVPSKRAKITVTKPTAITTDLSETEVNYCKGATTVNKLSVTAEGTGTLSYKWYKANNTTDAGTEISGATTNEYTPVVTTEGTNYYYVKVSSTCGEVTSKRAKITITKPTAITTNLSTTEVKYCKDEPSPAALNVVAEGTGTLTYQWYKAADATSAGTQIAGQTTATLAASAIEVATRGTTYYYVVVHSNCGTDVTSDRAKITITDPDTPIVDATQNFCNTATIADLRPNDSDIKWYASPTGGAPLTDGTRALAHGNKYYAARTLGSCESPRAEVTVNITTLTTPVVTEISTPACGQANVLTITTGFDTDATYTFVKEDDTPVSGGSVEGANHKITGLAPGKYKVKATKGACNLFSGVFEVKAAFIRPAKPEITLTPASCTSPTVAKLTQVSELTFWHNGTKLEVNPITHEITGLAPGTYTITAKNNNNCESVPSDRFEIKAQQTATTITTHPAGATYQKGAEATPLAVVATGEGTLSYKWYNNTDNNNTSGTEVGDNSPSYKPATDRVGTFYYWVEVTSNCGAKKSTVAEIKVVEGAPTIEANDDPDTTVRRGQEVAVLGNDKVNGNPATPADVDITISNDGGLTRVGVNPATGKIMIPNDAAPATYEITYKICVKNQPTICDEAKVKITVEVPVRALKAVDDDFGKIPNAVDYTTVATVFSSGVDTMEGVVGNLSPERDVVLTPGVQPHETITMNPNGSITVKRGTPKGTYTYEYTICQKDVPTNCDTAKVSFEVIEAHIFAKDDGVWEVGTEGALTPSVLNNDILGERVGIAPSEVSITKTNGKPVIDDTKMVMNEDGRISVKKNIPEGTYTYYYTITEKANRANTSSASVTIRVVSFSAQDDEFDITNDKTKEFKTESVLKNDELNKKKNPSPVDDVILTKGEAKDAERNPTNALTMNDDGTITIAPNTPDGVYTYTYKICKKSPQTECKSAEAVIKLLPALIANDDDFTANPINPLVKEGIAGNVLDNDRYADGNALEHLDKVEITMLEGQESRANIEPNGNVVIPQGAPAGEYTLKYNLCMKDHPTICAEAKVKIVILEDKPIVIHNGISANGDGVNDGFMIEHIEGYPKNNLKIFNRWGVLVYEKDGYTNSEPFDGHSNGRATISADSKLPQGTYYYILEYQDTAEQTHTKKGWLYLKY